MRRTVTLAVVLLLAAALPALAQQAADPFDATREAFMKLETPEEQLALVKQFLAEHPDHARVGDVLEAGVQLLRGPLEDPAGAVDLAETQLSRATSADSRAAVQRILLPLYGEPAHRDDLVTLVGDMSSGQPLTYVQHLDVIRAGVGAQAWELVDVHCAAATPQATAEQFLADYPDRDFSPQYAAEAGANRQGLLLTFQGWSAANQGDLDGAERTFRAASKQVRTTFLGVPENALYRYWGQTLLMRGDRHAGLEKLALAAVYGGDEAAGAAAREAFAALDNPGDYDDYLWQLRQKHAPRMVDFAATDYADQSTAFADVRGERATLLAFWFPT